MRVAAATATGEAADSATCFTAQLRSHRRKYQAATQVLGRAEKEYSVTLRSMHGKAKEPQCPNKTKCRNSTQIVQGGALGQTIDLVDFDLTTSDVCPILLRQLQIKWNWYNRMTHRNFKNLSQQNLGSDLMHHPVISCLIAGH